ncbi:glycosyltransferase [Pseudomonas silvicola]|nr:glycosyltransferase [Pseudomonas silvicola]
MNIPTRSTSTPRFSIAMVNYKTAELTRNCLELLREQLAGLDVPVWVVDNGSADASTAYLRGLDWINLIERAPAAGEPGHIAHGKALDLILERIDTEYILLMHTDTFIYNNAVFQLLLNECMRDENRVAAGCVEQLDRGLIRTAWRFTSRYCKHHYRRLVRAAGLPGRDPKPWKEVYLKSFCTLWNAKVMKQRGLHFCMDDRVPGYTLQDRMVEAGLAVASISPRRLFRYLDHIQAGTVAACGGYAQGHRRTRMYDHALARLNKVASYP